MYNRCYLAAVCWVRAADVTFILSYSLTAQLLASSVALIVFLISSNLRILDSSPPNILEDATSSFSALECMEERSDKIVCTVNSALERSENAPRTANINPRYSCKGSCPKHNTID